MNLLARLWRVLPILMLGVFFACDDPNEIGDVLNSGENKIEVLFKEFILPVDNVLIDSIKTDNRERILVGKYSDEVFGDVTATAYSQFDMSSATVNVRDFAENDFIIDSAHVNLDIVYYHSDDSLQGHGFELHTLADTLFSNVFYLSDFSSPDNNDLVGSLDAFFFRPTLDSIRVNLDFDFATSLLEFIDENTTSQPTFTAEGVFADSVYSVNLSAVRGFFKGLAIKPKEGNNGIFGFDFSNNTTKLEIYYRVRNETETDTVSSILELRTTTAGSKYYNLQIDRSSAVINETVPAGDIIFPFDAIDGNIFLQSGTGVHPRIDMQPVNDFLSSVENIIINRADIELSTTDENSTFKFLPKPEDLRFFFYNDDGTSRDRNINVPGLLSNNIDNTVIMTNISYLGGGAAHLTADLDKDNALYSADATLFTQFVEAGNINTDKLIAIPSDVSSMNRVIFDASSVKMKIFYTVPK